MGLLINEEDIMLTYTYIEHGKFELREKPEPEIVNSREAIVRVTLGSICTSDLHIKHGSVPRAVPGITVGQRWWVLWKRWGLMSPRSSRGIE